MSLEINGVDFEMDALTEREQAIMYITLGNPGKQITEFHYSVDENGIISCFSRFDGDAKYCDWRAEFQMAFGDFVLGNYRVIDK